MNRSLEEIQQIYLDRRFFAVKKRFDLIDEDPCFDPFNPPKSEVDWSFTYLAEETGHHEFNICVHLGPFEKIFCRSIDFDHYTIEQALEMEK